MDKIQTITLRRKEMNGMYRVEVWNFPLDVLVKFKSLMLSQSNYFWRRFLADHPVTARYRVANTDQPFFISPKSIFASNPRIIYHQGAFNGYMELFPNTEIFISEQAFKIVSTSLIKVHQFRTSTRSASTEDVEAETSR